MAIYSNNSSGLKGVWLEQRTGRWKASISVHRVRLYLGWFLFPDSAARAYDHAAVRHFGEYAVTNAGLGLVSHDGCGSCTCSCQLCR